MIQNRRLFFLFPFFLVLCEFCANMSNDMYIPALPQIAREFQVPINLVQLTITAWLVGSFSVQLIIGPLADQWGRRPIFLGGGLLFLAATLICGLAPSLKILILARFFQGMGVCAIMVAGYASIYDLYEKSRHLTILSWMGSAAVLAPAIGPMVGGVLLVTAGWRITFYFLLGVATFALMILWIVMPESLSKQNIESLKVGGLIDIYRKILLNKRFNLSALSFGFLYGGIVGWITSSPYLLMDYLTISPLTFGWLQLIIFGGYILGALVIKSFIAPSKKEEKIPLGIMVALLGALFLILFPHLFTHAPWILIAPMTLYMVGFGMAAAPLTRKALLSTKEKKGAAVAFFYLEITVIGALVSLILSLYDENFYITTAIISFSIFLSFMETALKTRLDRFRG